jgi:hypothetical protein
VKNTTTAIKSKLNQAENTSFDVSYAEILAEVQKLQQMLDGNVQTEQKQRKKRTLKVKVEQNQSESSMEQMEAQGGQADMEIDNESKSEVKASSHRYKVSNLDEIRDKISEVKELIEEADHATSNIVAAVEEAQAQIDIEANGNVHVQTESDSQLDTEVNGNVDVQPESDAQVDIEANGNVQSELDIDSKMESQPEQVIQTEESQPEIFQAITKEVVEEHAEIKLDEQATSIGCEQADELLAKPKKAATKSAKTVKETKAIKEPKAPKAKAEAKTPASDLDAYFLEGDGQPAQDAPPVGLAEELHAAQLAKHGVKNEDEIIKSNKVLDKSGTEWGGNVNLEDDPNLDHPQP